jgi:hypothetical protein
MHVCLDAFCKCCQRGIFKDLIKDVPENKVRHSMADIKSYMS